MREMLSKDGLQKVWNAAKNKFVAKEDGKGLSTNDFTDEDKEKLDGLNNAVAGTATPLMAAETAAVGTADAYAREDHVHPSDTTKLDADKVGVADGVASLGADGKVPSEQLPSYVDDVVELTAMSDTAPATAATGDKYFNSTDNMIYTATAENTWGTTGEAPMRGVIYLNLAETIDNSYRWGGTAMTKITSNDIVAISDEELDAILNA